MAGELANFDVIPSTNKQTPNAASAMLSSGVARRRLLLMTRCLRYASLVAKRNPVATRSLLLPLNLPDANDERCEKSLLLLFRFCNSVLFVFNPHNS